MSRPRRILNTWRALFVFDDSANVIKNFSTTTPTAKLILILTIFQFMLDIYNAKVTRLDNFDVEKYSGAHEGPSQTRIYCHGTNMRNRHQRGTGLSKYVWKLKDNQPHPTSKPFDPVTGVCRLFY